MFCKQPCAPELVTGVQAELSNLSKNDRLRRVRKIDAARHRRQRGTITPEQFVTFVNSVNARFNVPVVQTATDVVTIGSKIEKLTVLSFEKNKWGQTVAVCSCECGKACRANISKLAQGIIVSCGCWKGTIYAPGTGDAVIASICTTYKAAAKHKNLSFSLDHFSIRKLVQSACFYCGTEPYRIWNIVKRAGIESLACNGIDRVDNERGYEPSNVVPCCPRCNYAKRDMSLQEFSAWALKLADHLRKHGVSAVGESLNSITSTTERAFSS